MIEFDVSLAGVPIHYQVEFKHTAESFRQFIIESVDNKKTVYVLPEDYMKYGLLNPNKGIQSVDELRLLLYATANVLIHYDCMLFHGVAFEWNDQIWILSGPSGVGKTTQYHNWNLTFPNDIQILNGDKPILKLDGLEWIVNPSPWTGKENYHSLRSGKLGGIILLEQDTNNYVRELSSKDAVIPILKQLFIIMENENTIDSVIRLEESILNSVPIFLFQNDGTVESTKLLRKFLQTYTINNKRSDENEI